MTAGSRSAAGKSVPGCWSRGVEGTRTKDNYVSVGGAVDGRPMIAAEDDRRPLQRAHRDGSGGHVPNREDIFNLYVNRHTACR